jgi:hypothetical protein
MEKRSLKILIIMLFYLALCVSSIRVLADTLVHSHARDPSSGTLYGGASVDTYVQEYSNGATFTNRCRNPCGAGHNPPSYPYMYWGENWHFDISHPTHRFSYYEMWIVIWNGQNYVVIDSLRAEADIWANGNTRSWSKHG